MDAEHDFWLAILRDHLTFIFDALSSEEVETLNVVKALYERIGPVLLRKNNNEALSLAQDIRNLKLNLLGRHLTQKIKIALPPTFINHMLNEIDEYISIITYHNRTGLIKAPDNISLHLLWLPDAEGHAVSIKSALDPIEKKPIKELKELKKKFNALFMKALEFKGYLRALSDFPALNQLNDEVNNEMNIFIRLLNEIKDLRMIPELLGTIQPLMLDHMIREELYYLNKLAQT